MSAANRAGFRGDTRWLSIPALLIMGAVAAAAFALSYQGLATVSIAAGVVPWILPLFLDGGILASGLIRAMLRGQRRKTWFAVVLLVASTFVSSGINFLVHVTRGDNIEVVLTASLAPIFFLGFTELMIFAVVQHEVAERKPRREKKTAVTQSAAQPATSLVSTAKPMPRPRLVRPDTARPTSSGRVELPFEEVIARDEETLLVDLVRLAADPASSEARTPESALLSATVWALVEHHGHSIAALSRQVGHETPDKLKDRLRNARKKAPIAA